MTPEELKAWFQRSQEVFSTAYLSHEEPWRQSGFSGPEDRWISLRKPVADCIDRDGTFLDIGCANGYLIECCLRWTAERGIRIEPYGVDQSIRLVERAKERLPQYADRFFVANAFEWIPSMKFDFVRTELVYVPGEYERQFVDHLLTHVVKPGGRLLVASYAEDHPDVKSTLFPGSFPAPRILDRLATLGLTPVGHKDGFDPVKGRKTRVVMLVK